MSSKQKTPEKAIVETKPQEKKNFPWPTVLSWGATGLLVVILLLALFQKFPFSQDRSSESVEATAAPLAVALPSIENTNAGGVKWLVRETKLDTVIPDNTRQTIIKYKIETGDSLFSIAGKFGLQPQSVLWANDDYFGGDPTVTLSVGVDLTIPPTDGILYTWKEGDDLEKIANEYNASEVKIIGWPSNHLDVTNPVVTAGSYVMIPGGWTTIKSWIQEVEYTPRSGVTKTISGPGGCAVTSGYGPLGSTAFIWPAAQASISGWDFSSFHKGIDIAAYVGEAVWAADSGTVVYAGWNDTGYGYMVMIDHNNGYQTLYGHMSALYVSCGQNVYQGTTIGAAGSTGKSTGPHLHFEIRKDNSFINPWYVLP